MSKEHSQIITLVPKQRNHEKTTDKYHLWIDAELFNKI